eukprot:351999-Chlamydomonas_euryale.AAC.1
MASMWASAATTRRCVRARVSSRGGCIGRCVCVCVWVGVGVGGGVGGGCCVCNPLAAFYTFGAMRSSSIMYGSFGGWGTYCEWMRIADRGRFLIAHQQDLKLGDATRKIPAVPPLFGISSSCLATQLITWPEIRAAARNVSWTGKLDRTLLETLLRWNLRSPNRLDV